MIAEELAGTREATLQPIVCAYFVAKEDRGLTASSVRIAVVSETAPSDDEAVHRHVFDAEVATVVVEQVAGYHLAALGPDRPP